MARAKSKTEKWLTVAFLLVEAALYAMILTGQMLVYAQYISVCLCLVFVLFHLRKANYFIVGGLVCTVIADWFLVMQGAVDKPPALMAQDQLYAMTAFLVAQILYAIQLHRRARSTQVLIIRLLLVVILEAIAVIVMGGKPDLLVIVSLCYYANLFVNILSAFRSYRKDWMMPWAMVLFFICDTFIGLQVAAGSYLTIAPDGLLHSIIFFPFNIAWACYLPSQVLIALYGRHNRR